MKKWKKSVPNFRVKNNKPDKEKKFLFCIHDRWLKGDYRSSVKAEPLGVSKTLRAKRSFLKGKRIAILTDHDNLVHASQACFVHSFHYNNNCLKYLEKLKREDNTTSFLYYLEGIKNTADGLSRGQTWAKDKSFPEVGAGLGKALTVPWQL